MTIAEAIFMRCGIEGDWAAGARRLLGEAAMNRILILGGGFGGVYAGLRLQALAGRRQDIQVTLVSRDNYFLFTPMLPQAATSSVDTRHIVQNIRRICPRIKFLEAEIDA